ncbi:MAG: hypothetical protein ACLR07_10495 [Christensenellales bacterium]
MRIDVYDFDGTIYDGDSTVDFTRFCLRRHPGVLAGLPKFLGTSLLLAAGRRSLTQFKSVLFGEMARRFNLETEAELFWQAEATRAKLGKWFLTGRAICRLSSLLRRRSLSCNMRQNCWACRHLSARNAT